MKNFSVLPYMHIDGIPTLLDSEIKRLYLITLQEAKLAKTFPGGGIYNAEDFLNYFKQNNELYVFIDEAKNFYGYFWVNLFERFVCRAHFCMFKNAGKSVIRLGKMALMFLQDYYCLIQAIIPESNKLACKFAIKIGMTPLGIIPNRLYNHQINSYVSALMLYTKGKRV